MRHAAITTVLLALAAHAAAQQPAAFDVASVKANHSGLPTVNFGMPGGGRFTATNAPLRELIRVAFDNLPDFLIPDAPDWIRVERFDIVAKAEGAADRDQLFAMIRTLLTDRFKVATHRETRELPQYTLVRAKPDGALGPRLRPAAADCAAIMAAAQNGTPPPRSDRVLCGSRNRPGLLAIGGMTMDRIARGLWTQLGRVVIDRTGLQGSYDLDLEFAPDLSTPSDLTSIFTAVQEQLGLKLESTKGPVEVIVIDHVERPTEN
jgi:uncharacterized protein (TIGR03435 family)